MKNKKIIIGVIIAIIILVIGIVAFVLINNKQNEEKATQVLYDFVGMINDKNYEGMYEKVTNTNISKEDFIKRNKNIYEGIDSSDIKIEINKIEKQSNTYIISYHEKMYTSAGQIEFDNTANIEDFKIKWSSKIIFPQLGEEDKVKVSTLKSKRGSILDRNGQTLASDGQVATVGIVPGKIGENKEDSVKRISELTGVSTDYINQQLNASYVKEDTFVTIKKIVESNTALKNKLLEIPGVMINKQDGRVYQFGKEAGHLIGYVQSINAEELQQNEGKNYNTNSVIGKSGLEKVYEDTLRGIDGTQITITDKDSNVITSLAKQDKKDGQDLKLTIDTTLQSKLYEQLKDDKGFFVVMEPQTGELLALVSTPTYDSNDFVVGLTTEQWNGLNNDKNKPLYNRFIQKYCPGSTFKPVTGAIGVSTGKINPNEDFGYRGTSWQKDSSWGTYKITTLTDYNGPKNLLNAMMYSDNIYFAQSALKIGADTFTENLNKIKFNQQLEFPINLAQSQYANNNGTTIESEIKLADSGYGQGSILVNPIHMASIYSAFANEGNMIKPFIIYDEEISKNGKGNVLIQQAFSQEAANTIKDSLIQVVNNPSGTASDMKVQGTTIAGKTGTAELKKSGDDTESGTLGWFDCFTIDKSDGNNMLIISMVENVQGNSDGGSHYLIKKIKTLF